MPKQLEEQLDYDDALLQFYTICTQYGCRNVLKDFRQAFPDLFQELSVQLNRLTHEKQEPALFRARTS